jgi:hypothetical protein
MRLRITVPARHESIRIAKRYDRLTPGRGDLFLADLGRTMAMARLFAQARRLKWSGPEKREFRRFPYAALYVVEDGVMYVLAIGHARRGPRYWKRKSMVARE